MFCYISPVPYIISILLQTVSPKEWDREIQKDEARWLNASQLYRNRQVIVPSSFCVWIFAATRERVDFSLFFSQLKIQVLMAESDLGSVWNYYFSSVLTNWIFLHFSSQFHFLICVLNNLEVPLEVDIHFKMKNQSTGFWKWQIKLSYYLFIYFIFCFNMKTSMNSAWTHDMLWLTCPSPKAFTVF